MDFEPVRKQIQNIIDQAALLVSSAGQVQLDSQNLLVAVQQLYENTQTPVIATLKVQYRSQWDSDATLFASDCGPACVAMILEFHGTRIGIDQLSKEASMTSARKYTVPMDLIHAAELHGVKLVRRVGMTVADLQAEVAAHRPVIALIHYGALGDLRQDTAFKAGHWVVVIGADDKNVVVNDPDWRGDRRYKGDGLLVQRATFEKAWADCILDGNTANQCLVVGK